jgi:hypothetical protein
MTDDRDLYYDCRREMEVSGFGAYFGDRALAGELEVAGEETETPQEWLLDLKYEQLNEWTCH